mgnify:CR=1 FL=1
MFTTSNCLLLAAVLFAIGAFGVVARRNLFLVLMAIEIMLASVNLTVLAFARRLGGEAGHDGQVFVIFNFALAAAAAAIGLALLISLYRHLGTVDADRAATMKG